MKKEYKKPLAEKLEFDYSETVTASGTKPGALTDQATTAWWKCETRYTDVHSIDNTVCGYI
jgi:hypothetical protein